jgi:hypothetical protein
LQHRWTVCLSSSVWACHLRHSAPAQHPCKSFPSLSISSSFALELAKEYMSRIFEPKFYSPHWLVGQLFSSTLLPSMLRPSKLCVMRTWALKYATLLQDIVQAKRQNEGKSFSHTGYDLRPSILLSFFLHSNNDFVTEDISVTFISFASWVQVYTMV